MMLPLSQASDFVYLAISLAQWAILAVALVHVIRTRPDAYPATGKQSKKFWLLVLGIGLVLRLTISGPIGIVGIAATIAGVVYLVDVKPAIEEILRRPRW